MRGVAASWWLTSHRCLITGERPQGEAEPSEDTGLESLYLGWKL